MSTTLCPQPAAASFARRAVAAKWGGTGTRGGHRRGSWVSEGILCHARAVLVGVAALVLGLAAILQLWLREGAGCGCAGVRGCAQAGGIISSYYSTSQSKCFLKASIH